MKKVISACILIATTSLAAESIPQASLPKRSWPTIHNHRNYSLFFFGEFIEWRYSSPNLTYGRDGIGLTNASPANEIEVFKTGTSYYPDFGYNPGFRIGTEIKFGPDRTFDLIGIYTWLHSTSKGHITAEKISASFVPIDFLTSSTSASNSYSFASLGLNLYFNWIELQSGYTFNPSRYLALRPYLGLLSILVEGDLHARYDFTLTTYSGGAPVGTFEIAKTHGQCSSWSIGPKMGLEFIVHATKNFGIYSHVAWSQQATSIHMKTKETEEQPARGIKFVIQRGKLHANHNVGIFNLELGPTWDQWFCSQKCHLQLRATWIVSTLPSGANLSFLNNNNADIIVGSEFRGYTIRGAFEF